MKQFYAYIRVSTARQEEQGASLAEQRSAIQRYAERQNLHIVDWFEEVETAAKTGRRIFAKILKLLRAKKADGLIMHKIDRSTRNYYDWAEINALADEGISIHYASENLELGSRGRRLMADIQAVFATDYIRNLKEEIHKGIDGRLSAGLITWKAPLGYVNNGRGQVKTICPHMGPLVRQAFELYAFSDYTLETLRLEMARRGLARKGGKPLSVEGMATVLKNVFYIGIIFVRQRGTTYEGAHKPLVPVSLFKRVQGVLEGKIRRRTARHVFRYRRLFRCASCASTLTPERQKGHVYYRCHDCRGASVREEAIETEIRRVYERVSFTEEMATALRRFLDDESRLDREAEKERRKVATVKLGTLEERRARLVDLMLEGTIESDDFEAKKAALLMEKKKLEEDLRGKEEERTTDGTTIDFFELLFNPWLSHSLANDAEKRDLLQLMSSNRTGSGKTVEIETRFPVSEATNDGSSGMVDRFRSKFEPRMQKLLRHRMKEVEEWVKGNPQVWDSISHLREHLP